jgi:hypothetical protein
MKKKMTTAIKSKPNSSRMVAILPKAKRLLTDDVLTPAEAKKVRLGERQIKEGKFKLWHDVKRQLDR